MKMIAAMHARSETVRGAPPRAWEGGGGSSGCRRCHNASGSRRSARLFIAGDHHTQLTAQTSSGMSSYSGCSDSRAKDGPLPLRSNPSP
jgi:hypothetical protein